MDTNMKLQKVPVDKLKPAKYNPRKDLKPGDPAYEKIKRSMTTYANGSTGTSCPLSSMETLLQIFLHQKLRWEAAC